MAETAERQPHRWWRRTEFWMTVGSTLGAIGTAVAGVATPAVSAAVSIVSIVAYTISRGIAKQGTGR